MTWWGGDDDKFLADMTLEERRKERDIVRGAYAAHLGESWLDEYLMKFVPEDGPTQGTDYLKERVDRAPDG